MKYIKRDPSLDTVEQVVARNLGLPAGTDVKSSINQWYKNSSGGEIPDTGPGGHPAPDGRF